MRNAAIILALAATVPSMPATAQDMIVMRRPVAQANFGQHHWQVGAYVSNAPACSDQAPATTTVQCVRNSDGTPVDVRNCQGTAPPTNGTVQDYWACTYRWEQTQYAAWNEACSDATYRTRPQAACQRVGGATAVAVDASFCSGAGTRPATREDAANYAGCTFTWAVKTSVCDGSGFRDLAYQCERTGGSSAKAVMTTQSDVANCGTMPSTRVADSSCGAPSLLTNGGFEEGMSAWATTGQGRVVTAAEQGLNGQTGSGAMAFQFITGTTLNQTLRGIGHGRAYRLTFKVSASSDNLFINLTGPGSSRRIWLAKPGSTWTEYYVDFTAGPGDEKIEFVSSNLAYIDDVEVRRK